MTASAPPGPQRSTPAIVHVLRRRLWLFIGVAVLVPAGALAYSLSQEKQYSATAQLLFRDPQFDQKLFGSSIFAPTGDPSRDAATNTRLVSLSVVGERAAKRLE